MTDPTTPFQKISDTSRQAAVEKDASGTTLDQDEILLAFFQQRGARGVYIFEAAEHLTARLGYEVVPGTASGRINDLMQDEKCKRWFGCGALVKKSKKLPRKANPKSGKSAGAYILKSFEPDDGTDLAPPPSEGREAGAIAATVAPAAAAPTKIKPPTALEKARAMFAVQTPPQTDNWVKPLFIAVDPATGPDRTAVALWRWWTAWAKFTKRPTNTCASCPKLRPAARWVMPSSAAGSRGKPRPCAACATHRAILVSGSSCGPCGKTSGKAMT